MCDTLAIVTGDGVWFAKSSDRDANEAQLLDWQPRRAYPDGARLRCTWIEIPQVRETAAVLLSRPYWMWGAEIGANEHGVLIGNEAVFTRQPYQKSGLTGMDLLRLGLERADSARAAVDVILALLEQYGQGGGCGYENRRFTYHNAFIIADATGAFVLETAGRLYALEEVCGARSISNGLTIAGFAEQHSDTVKTWASQCRLRQPRTQALAERASSPADLAAILRDHGDGHGHEPDYHWLTGALSAPCVHPGGLAASSQTTASWIAELRPGAVRHWVTATAAPCTGLFKPVEVAARLDLGPAPTDRADAQSLWWRHEKLHRLVSRNPDRLLPRYAEERDRVEARWFSDPPEPAAAFAEGDRLLAEWTKAVAAAEVPDARPWLVRRFWRKRERMAGRAGAPLRYSFTT